MQWLMFWMIDCVNKKRSNHWVLNFSLTYPPQKKHMKQNTQTLRTQSLEISCRFAGTGACISDYLAQGETRWKWSFFGGGAVWPDEMWIDKWDGRWFALPSYSHILQIIPWGSFDECHKSLLSRASLWDGATPSPIEREREINEMFSILMTDFLGQEMMILPM